MSESHEAFIEELEALLVKYLKEAPELQCREFGASLMYSAIKIFWQNRGQLLQKNDEFEYKINSVFYAVLRQAMKRPEFLEGEG